MKYYLILLLLISYSCNENPCESTLSENIQNIDSLKQRIQKNKFTGDSLKACINSELFEYFPRENFSFGVYPSNYTVKKGEEMQVIAVIRLKSASATFMALPCILRNDTANVDYFKNLSPISDTLYPTKEGEHNSILIKKSAVNDSIEYSSLYYLLLQPFGNNDTIKALFKPKL